VSQNNVPQNNVSKVLDSSDVSSPKANASADDQGLKRRRPTVALTLGSGGARGYAHIGAIEILAERGS